MLCEPPILAFSSIFLLASRHPSEEIQFGAGLLEGAHIGIGLGHEFLRHCQRARVLVHVIDGSRPDPMADYHAIQTELQLFDPCLAAKPQVRVLQFICHRMSSHYEFIADELSRHDIARTLDNTKNFMKEMAPLNKVQLISLYSFSCARGRPLPFSTRASKTAMLWFQVVAYNKVDLPDSSDYYEDVRDQLLSKGVAAADIFSISAATGNGILNLVRHLHSVLDKLKDQVQAQMKVVQVPPIDIVFYLTPVVHLKYLEIRQHSCWKPRCPVVREG